MTAVVGGASGGVATHFVRDTLLPNAALVGVGGFLLARSYYNSFFGALGVDPASVGLDYLNTLTSSVGFLLYVALWGVALPAALIIGLRAAAYLTSPYSRHAKGSALLRETRTYLHRHLPSDLRLWMPAAATAAIVALTVLVADKGADYAADVRAGKPVRIGSTTFASFGVRATPVLVQPTDNSKETPTLGNLSQRATEPPGLLYLGQSAGQVVLYDARTQAAVHVPADFLVIELANCEQEKAPFVHCSRAVD